MRRAKYLLAYLLLPSLFVPMALAQNMKAGAGTATAAQTAKPITIPFKEFKL